MARYRWNCPHEWLSEKIKAAEEAVLAYLGNPDCANLSVGDRDDVVKAFAYIVSIANNSCGELVHADSIQDLYQDEMEEDGYFRDLSLIDALSREKCVEILEGADIQCYDEESMETLKTAIEDNVNDGTIPWEEIKNA